MLDYVQKSRLRYPPAQFPVEFVRCVFEEARKRDRGKEQVYRGTKALVELIQQKGAHAFISVKEIQEYAGIWTSQSAGLWPWRQKSGANVVEEQVSPKTYRIRPEFFDAMQSLFTDGSGPRGKRSILELQGLGKEIWAGIDPRAYVNRERASWAG
jgi:hypothetical protein